MGTWSTSLYGGDFTCDVRDEYKNFLLDGHTPQEAISLTAQIMTPEQDDEEGHLFWLVIADVQWRLGQLLPEVRQKAVDIIETGEDLGHWGGEKEKITREKILNSLMEKLNSPQPKPRTLRPPKGYKCPWVPGDLVAARVGMTPEMIGKREGPEYRRIEKYAQKYILLHMVAIMEEPTSCDRHCAINYLPVFAAYNWDGDELPTEDIATQTEYVDLSLSQTGTGNYFLAGWIYHKYDHIVEPKKIGFLEVSEQTLADYKWYGETPGNGWISSYGWISLTYSVVFSIDVKKYGESKDETWGKKTQGWGIQGDGSRGQITN